MICGKRKIILFSAFVLVTLVLSLLTQSFLKILDVNHGKYDKRISKQVGDDQLSQSDKHCDEIEIVIVCAGYNASREVVTLVKSLLFYRKSPIHVHFVVDPVAKIILGNLFRTWDISEFTVSFYPTSKLAEKVSWIPNFHYSGVFGLLKLVLLDVLPQNIQQAIVLDVDLILQTDITELWRLIKNFNENQAFGLVENQSDWYLGKLHVREVWPALGRGFNSGLVLLNCRKLRQINWNQIWEETAKDNLKHFSGTPLADQDIINAVIKKYPHLVYVIPCVWNVQLSMFTLAENCYGNDISSIKVLHWNSPQKVKLHLDSRFYTIFKNIHRNFLEYDGNLLKHFFSGCSQHSSFPVDQYEANDPCQDLIFKSLQLRRTHLFFLPFDYTPDDAHDVTLTTHLSMDRLPMLEQACKNWQGPVSAAIFLRDSNMEELYNFVKTSSVLSSRTNVAYHIVFRNFDDVSYPINLLRNIALQQAVTNYVFLCDVDFQPSFKLYEYLKNAVLPQEKTSEKVAFVVPAFESLWYKFNFPATKSELIDDWEKGALTPFRSYMWAAGHAATDFAKWKKSDDLYSINRTKDFEPYVVVPKRYCPPYDKRFFGFGWNKVSHIIELDAAGFQFKVLPHGFILHTAHMPSIDILKYRTSDTYRRCIYDIKMEFINDLSMRYKINITDLK